MTPIQLQYKTGGSPGPRVAFKSRTHWSGMQQKPPCWSGSAAQGDGGSAVLCRGSARQPTVLAHGCALGSGTVKHTGHRWLGWTSVRRWITAAHPEVESAFGEQPSLTMPITRRATGRLGGGEGAGRDWRIPLALPAWAAGPVHGAQPTLLTPRITLAWLPRSLPRGRSAWPGPGVSVLTMTTACGGMNSVQGQGATATPP